MAKVKTILNETDIVKNGGSTGSASFATIEGSIYDNASATTALNAKANQTDLNATDARVEALEDGIVDKLDKQPNIQVLWTGTQAEYEALTPTTTTLYFIKE